MGIILFLLLVILHTLSILSSQITTNTIDTNTDAPWYYSEWCGAGLEFLDDSLCQKVFPSQMIRSTRCNTTIIDSYLIPELEEQGYSRDASLSMINVDTITLTTLVDDEDVNACVVLTKHVQDGDDIVLFNKYLCLDDRSVNNAVETWSSSKIFAVANAAGRLRSNETSCVRDEFGLPSNTSGNHDATPLGDLITIICSYDETAGYSSNGLSSYFHDIGWRDRIHSLVGSAWLDLSANQTLGGNYGVATPSDLSFTMDVDQASCDVDVDPWPEVYDNSLSSLAAAEMVRRIVLHDDLSASLRFPGLKTEDALDIMYGAASSKLFPGELWGGMSADTAIFLQSALDMTDVEARSDGAWRILSKLGAGYSNSRGRGEIITSVYTCIPEFSGNGSTYQGDFEFTLSVRGSVVGDSSLKLVQAKVAAAVNAIVTAIMNGTIS